MKTFHREDTSYRKHYSISKKFIKFQPHLLYAGHSVKKHGWSEKVHSHNFCEILFITGGKGLINVGGEVFSVKEGDLIVYNPECPHAEESIANAPLDFFFCAFDGFALSDFPPCHLTKEPFCVLHTEDEAYKQLLDNFSVMIYEQKKQELFYVEISSLVSHQILLFVLRLISSSEEENKGLYEHHILKRVSSYLRENFSQKLTLEEIAAECFVSKYYLSHLFREHKGLTVGEYLKNLRIEKAQEMLKNSDDPVTEIAFACGFHDTHYFYRVFKAHTGVTPAQYRREKTSQVQP